MKTESKTSVAIVLDPDFGSALEPVANDMHVWIVDTPANQRAIDELYSTDDRWTCGTEISTFKATPGKGLSRILRVIENRHLPYSPTGPYYELAIFGLALGDDVQCECETFGFNDFKEVDGGFTAKRPEDYEFYTGAGCGLFVITYAAAVAAVLLARFCTGTMDVFMAESVLLAIFLPGGMFVWLMPWLHPILGVAIGQVICLGLAINGVGRRSLTLYWIFLLVLLLGVIGCLCLLVL